MPSSVMPWRRDSPPTPVFFSFPGGSAGKESACSAGDLGSIPGLGRFPGEGKGYPLQCSGLENSMDRAVHGAEKSWTRLSAFRFHFLWPVRQCVCRAGCALSPGTGHGHASQGAGPASQGPAAVPRAAFWGGHTAWAGPHRRMQSVPRIRAFSSPPAGRALCASFPGCESLACISSDVFITVVRSPQAPGVGGVQKWPAHPW